MELLKELQKKKVGSRSVVLAYGQEIRDALARGYTLKDVWETLSSEGILRVGYQQFAYLVRCYLSTQRVEGELKVSKQSDDQAQRSADTTAPRRFEFGNKDKSELI